MFLALRRMLRPIPSQDAEFIIPFKHESFDACGMMGFSKLTNFNATFRVVDRKRLRQNSMVYDMTFQRWLRWTFNETIDTRVSDENTDPHGMNNTELLSAMNAEKAGMLERMGLELIAIKRA